MSPITRGTASLLVGVALTALMAGSAVAADKIRDRDRLQDGSCQAAATGESLSVEARTRTQDRACVADPASQADTLRTRSQDRTCVTEPCPQEPAEPIKARTRDQERDRTGENDDATTVVRERVEEQVRTEECREGEAAGPQGPCEAAGPQGPCEPSGPQGPADGCEPCEPLQTQTQTRAGHSGPGSGTDGS